MKTWWESTPRRQAWWDFLTASVVVLLISAVFTLLLIWLSGAASAAPYQCRTYGYSGETFTSCAYDDAYGHHHTTTTCNQWGCTTREDS